MWLKNNESPLLCPLCWRKNVYAAWRNRSHSILELKSDRHIGKWRLSGGIVAAILENAGCHAALLPPYKKMQDVRQYCTHHIGKCRMPGSVVLTILEKGGCQAVLYSPYWKMKDARQHCSHHIGKCRMPGSIVVTILETAGCQAAL